jgi:polar amino acid transport system substrate-binding protein
VRTPTLGALASTAVLAFAVTGCGSDDSDTKSTASGGSGESTAAATVDQAIADQVPAEIKSKGTLKVGSDPTYAPNEFLDEDGKTIIGMDPDLGKALADVMGLKVEFEKAGFDAILPGLASNKYDLGISSFTDTKEREQEFDFVTYFRAGTSFFVKAEGGPNVTKLTELCGHKVAVQKGTTQQDEATAQAKECGSSKLDVQVYPDQNGANQALISGRADVGMADSPIAAYQVKQTEGQFKLSGEPYGTAPYGIALPKGSELAPAIQAALKKLIENGEYAKILGKWGVESGAITEPEINGAES